MIRPEDADAWPEIRRSFTEATRAEPGCPCFDWSRSLDNPTEYVLVEAFRDDEAGGAHVRSDHFKAGQRDLPPHLAETRGSSTSPSRGRIGPNSENCGSTDVLLGGTARRRLRRSHPWWVLRWLARASNPKSATGSRHTE